MEAALDELGFDSLVVSSGEPHTYFSDDQEAPFRSVPHFAHWCPVPGPHHVLHVQPGKRPLLIRFAAEDYWYEPAELGDPYWASQFELVEAPTVDAVWERLGWPANAAYVGNELSRAAAAGLDANPDSLVARLDWDRAYKTDFELQCLDDATVLAAAGHRAAVSAFESGGSELDVHYAFLAALERSEHELPYPTIIALDEKAAFLHYHSKRKDGEGRVLLIDAGATHEGYASDITRTHVREDCDPRFVALRDGMDALQRRLCDSVRPNVPYGDLHHQAHVEIAALLADSGLVHGEPEAIVGDGLSQPFFPHGLGHHLGLQVHDVGGHLADASGAVQPPPESHPFLRNTRTTEPRHVFTIEPGLYFIDMLLRPFREGAHADRFDWKLIDELAPLGGIRVEDNVVVTEDGHRNLTRPHLPS